VAEAKTSNKSGNILDLKLIFRIFGYVRPYRKQFTLSLITTLSLTFLTPIRPYLIQYILDKPVPAGDSVMVRNLILLLIGLTLIQAVIQYWNTYITAWLGQTVMRDLRNIVYKHILRQKLSFFDRTPIGTLQTRTISDIETLNDIFSDGLVTIVGEILQVIALVGIMAYTDVKLTIITLLTLPLMLLSTWVFKVKVKASFQEVRKYVASLNAFLQEHISGMAIVQLFGREKEEQKRFSELNKNHMVANLKSVMYYSVFFPVVDLILALATALLVWYGAGSVLEGEITFGVLVAFLMYIQMFFRPIRMLADQFNQLQMGMVSAERIFKVLDSEDIIPDTGTFQDQLPEKIEIRFDDVRFGYKPDEPVLKGISFTVEPGTVTAIVGATGSGKTTLMSLLSRFYDTDSGTITVGGQNIKDFSLPHLRKTVGIVLQEVFLFSGSVMENITLNNPDIKPEKVKEAAKYVGADHFIESLPGGYDYKVMERGATLSSGQRQLISFVRALVYDPKILVLDEATSNIDTETEQLIQEAVKKLMKGRTSIIIAHRLSTIHEAKQIVVIHKGELIEKGSHTELIGMNGQYAKLYQLQYAKETVSV
jgi:ATP-binding cassette subfamily B protein